MISLTAQLRRPTASRCGLSLTELMAVLGILGVLAVLIVPRVISHNDTSKRAACDTNQGEIELQIKLWRRNQGAYPAANLSDIGAAPEASDMREATVWLAVAKDKETVAISRGENRGKKITYSHPVRELTPIGMWKGEQMTLRLPLNELSGRDLADGIEALLSTFDRNRGPVALQTLVDAEVGYLLEHRSSSLDHFRRSRPSCPASRARRPPLRTAARAPRTARPRQPVRARGASVSECVTSSSTRDRMASPDSKSSICLVICVSERASATSTTFSEHKFTPLTATLRPPPAAVVASVARWGKPPPAWLARSSGRPPRKRLPANARRRSRFGSMMAAPSW